MRHVSWIPYTENDDIPENNHLFASNWYKLFEGQPTDGRHKLTWRNRFGAAVPMIYNFFSPGDPVYARHQGAIDPGDIWNLTWHSRFSWTFQEKLKGRMDLMNVLGSIYGGWGFNNYWSAYDEETNTWDLMPAADALALTPETLREHPFFNTGIGRGINGIEALFGETTGSDWAFRHHSALLSEFVPALSLSAGHQEVAVFGGNDN